MPQSQFRFLELLDLVRKKPSGLAESCGPRLMGVPRGFIQLLPAIPLIKILPKIANAS
jgi:hypothetical protein